MHVILFLYYRYGGMMLSLLMVLLLIVYRSTWCFIEFLNQFEVLPKQKKKKNEGDKKSFLSVMIHYAQLKYFESTIVRYTDLNYKLGIWFVRLTVAIRHYWDRSHVRSSSRCIASRWKQYIFLVLIVFYCFCRRTR